MPTVTWPPLTDCVGALAPLQPAGMFGTRPPAVRPFGTLMFSVLECDAPCAAARAAFCTAIIACTACVALLSDFCACCAIVWACWELAIAEADATAAAPLAEPLP